MESALIGIHAGAGELGAVAFLWVFVELLKPSVRRVLRAKVAALVGVLAFFASWLVGGYYYVLYYGAEVKPVIKAGPVAWAHEIVTETKEHVFLFIPFLALLALGLIYRHEEELKAGNQVRAILILSCAVALFAFGIAAMGYLISSGFRQTIMSQ